MMIKKIVSTKDSVLRNKSIPVRNIDKKIQNLAKDLVDTLIAQKDPPGIGLAACQIAKNVRMFAMKDKNKIRIIINPTLIKLGKVSKTKEKESVMEGCLSIPHYYAPLTRSEKVIIRFQELNNQWKKEQFSGLEAQIIQHEIDHLNGILFTDYLLKNKKSLYKIDPKTDEWEKVEL